MMQVGLLNGADSKLSNDIDLNEAEQFNDCGKFQIIKT
jgi:hypothetical protein